MQHLTPEETETAAQILRDGGLVAFPTETVYGLGARADDDHAVARIFEAKGRPSFNPLIVHVPSLEVAKGYAQIDGRLLDLANTFWPGPLSIVAPVKGAVSKLVTAGLATVALRVPDHPLAQDLLKRVGYPIAAPSANPSGLISPTTASHVADGLGGVIDAVLDGGATSVGVESTIIGAIEGRITILRPGGITKEQLEQVIGADIPLLTPDGSDAPNAPGQLLSHYAPRLPVRLDATSPHAGEVFLGFGAVSQGGYSLSASGDLREAAANLFKYLHELDDMPDATGIAVAPIPERGLGVAINDRLRRAAAPR